MRTSVTLQQMKRFVPRRLKRATKDALLDRKFRRAVNHVSKLPLGVTPDRQLLTDLIVGWGNEGFAAQLDYLEEVAARAAVARGPILECGSGLTSIVMGLLAGRRGVEIWSLEHYPEWRTRVMSAVRRSNVPNVQICLAPLQSFGDFQWYSPPLQEMPSEFQLVVCDGPPGDTIGGRYGLLPVMRERLSKDVVILLDDASRPGEAEVLQRWMSETNLEMSSPVGATFAVLTRK